MPGVGTPRGGFIADANVLNDAGAVIPKGTPVCLSLDGTDDGLAVKLPSGGGTQALADQFFYGVMTDTCPSGTYGRVVLFGVYRNAVLLRATRSADSVNWAGSTSMAKGVLLSLDTVNNCFSTAAGSTSFASTDTGGVYGSRKAFAFLASDVASFASSNSTATSIGTALTVAVRVFVRAL